MLLLNHIVFNNVFLDEVNSTNDYAANLIAKSNPIEGTVITASLQTAGKGQIGRRWFSKRDQNVLCSIILYPKFLQATDQFQLNIAVSLAIYDLIDYYTELADIKIKWPNDIYIGNRKIGGLLIQNSILGKSIHSAIIGAGININQTSFPIDIPNPTSLQLTTGNTLSLDQVRGWLFRFMTKRYLQLKHGMMKVMKKEYLQNLYLLDVLANYQDAEGNVFQGKIKTVGDTGKLVIEMVGGTKRSFNFKEIRFIGEQ